MKTRAFGLMAVGLLLAGCAGAAPATAPEQGAATRTLVPSATVPAEGSATVGAPAQSETRIDEQGVVVFEVTPLNLNAPGDTLDFDIVMDTHSVDLSWDLAAQSVLRTDTGLEVQGASWPVGEGHHYGGTLSFPATTADGDPILERASVLILVIRDTDVDEREFVWVLDR